MNMLKSFNTKKQNGRNKYLDIARGIAIILMVIGHVLEIGWKSNLIFSFHMPLFVIISGMFFKEKNLKEFIKNILIKLILPYIIAVFFVDIFKFIVINDNYNIMQFLKNYLKKILLSYSLFKVETQVEPLGVLWFLPFLAIIRIMYYFLKRIIKENDILLGICCLSLTYIGYMIGVKGYWLPYSLDVAMSSIIFYFIGYVLIKYNLLEKLLRDKKILVFLLIIWIIGIKYGNIELAVRKYPHGLFSFISAIAGSIIIFKLSMIIEKMISKIGNIFAWYGRNSMYILIFHYAEIYLINYIVMISGVEHKTTYKMLVILIKLLIVTIGAYIVDLIKKIKINKKIKEFFKS